MLQYNVSDPFCAKFVDGVGNLGGVTKFNGSNNFNPNSVKVNGNVFNGGPQMLRLTPDGKRLFVTNSLFSSWDDQFYPSGPGSMQDNGSNLIQLNTGVIQGRKKEKFTVNKEFGYAFKGVEWRLANGLKGIFRSRAHECHIRGVTH